MTDWIKSSRPAPATARATALPQPLPPTSTRKETVHIDAVTPKTTQSAPGSRRQLSVVSNFILHEKGFNFVTYLKIDKTDENFEDVRLHWNKSLKNLKQ